nr:uncharacterized protein LOC112941905 [Solanum lycopersicum]
MLQPVTQLSPSLPLPSLHFAGESGGRLRETTCSSSSQHFRPRLPGSRNQQQCLASAASLLSYASPSSRPSPSFPFFLFWRTRCSSSSDKLKLRKLQTGQHSERRTWIKADLYRSVRGFELRVQDVEDLPRRNCG